LSAFKAFPRLTKLHGKDRRRLISQMERDVDFLSRRNLMDFSMLLGIEKNSYVRNSQMTENLTTDEAVMVTEDSAMASKTTM